MDEQPKKKLLVTASTFPRWKDDTEPRFVLDLASHMKDAYDITVLVPAAPGAKEKEYLDGVKVIRYHYFPIHKWETLCYPGAIVPRIKEKKVRILLVPFLFLSLFFHLWKLLPEFDIVHAHWLIPQGIVQSFFKKPYIVTGHGGDVVSLNKGITRKLKIKCLKRAEHVTVVSEHLKKKVQELVPGILPDVISMGVNISQFGRKYRVPDYFGQGDKKVVLFVGRLAEKKGAAYLIKAMESVDAVLAIVGDGPLRENLEQQSQKINQRAGWKKVRLLGAKSHAELKMVYASADVFACPSVTAKDGDQEGFGLVMLEAMASDLPVIASNSGGITQLIIDGVNGLLCTEKCVEELAAAINCMLEDKALRDEIIENMKNMIKEYDYKAIAQRYMKVINNILSKDI